MTRYTLFVSTCIINATGSWRYSLRALCCLEVAFGCWKVKTKSLGLHWGFVLEKYSWSIPMESLEHRWNVTIRESRAGNWG